MAAVPAPPRDALELIHRASLQAQRMSESLRADQSVYVHHAALRAILDWKRDAEMVGFRIGDDGVTYCGFRVRAAM